MPTLLVRALEGGHGASAPLPTLRFALDRLMRSRQFIMAGRVAFFATHHMMIIIQQIPPLREHCHGPRSRRHPLRRPHAARPLHGRSVAARRPQARFSCDRRGAGARKTQAGADRRGLHGQCAPRRPGPGPGTAGRAWGKTAGCDRRHHREQGLRFRHEGDHAGARHHQCRLGRNRAVRRHGEHEQRALSAGKGALGLPRRP